MDFPLGRFVCVTGVSGGGKSTLTIETLFKTASMRLNGARQTPRALRDDQERLEHLDKVIDIDHGPSGARRGRTPRHIPAPLPRSATGSRACRNPKARGYKPGRFSFNVKGGPLRGLPGRRPHQDRDAFPARRLCHLRDLPRRALQPRDAGGAVQGQVHRRRALT